MLPKDLLKSLKKGNRSEHWMKNPHRDVIPYYSVFGSSIQAVVTRPQVWNNSIANVSSTLLQPLGQGVQLL